MSVKNSQLEKKHFGCQHEFGFQPAGVANYNYWTREEEIVYNKLASLTTVEGQNADEKLGNRNKPRGVSPPVAVDGVLPDVSQHIDSCDSRAGLAWDLGRQKPRRQARALWQAYLLHHLPSEPVEPAK